MADVIVPKQEKRKIPTQLDDFDAPTVNTYSLETTVAEKLDAILSLMEFSSRMKDYYDLYYLKTKLDIKLLEERKWQTQIYRQQRTPKMTNFIRNTRIYKKK